MKRWVLILVAVLGSPFYGCNMCCGPYDFDYPTTGGIHQRANPAYGRVGSIFSDPFATMGPSADSNLAAQPEPGFDDSNDLDGSGNDLDIGDRELENELEKKKRRDAIDSLESIEPELDDPDSNLLEPKRDDESTASDRWRPRPLRGKSNQWR